MTVAHAREAKPSGYVRLSHGMREDGRLLSVHEATRGRACNVVCPACKAPLVAKKGDVLSHHFAHASETACSAGQETIIHLLGKQIIGDSHSLWVPAITASVGAWKKELRQAQPIEADEAEIEASVGEYKPDVLLRCGTSKLAVEIYVTHRTTMEKIAAYRARDVDAVEIDLSQWRTGDLPRDFGAQVRRHAPRVWLRNGVAEAEKARMTEWLAAKRAEEEMRFAARGAQRVPPPVPFRVVPQDVQPDPMEVERRKRQQEAAERIARAPRVDDVYAISSWAADPDYDGRRSDPYRDGLLRGFHDHMKILHERGKA